MIALADCNTFFASVERVFHAGLRGKPVCVLSSNDGNIVALTSEAKALGLKRGDPFFRVRGIIEKNRVSVFSGNLMLYEAISKRVKSIMSQTVAHTESYSIDEQFLYLDGYDKHCDPVELMRGMVRKISLYTDIPVSVGIAKTKTLAKVASKFAKHYKGYGGVCMIDTDEKRRKALSLSQLDDIWGIGPKTFARLSGLGITNPLQHPQRAKFSSGEDIGIRLQQPVPGGPEAIWKHCHGKAGDTFSGHFGNHGSRTYPRGAHLPSGDTVQEVRSHTVRHRSRMLPEYALRFRGQQKRAHRTFPHHRQDEP